MALALAASSSYSTSSSSSLSSRNYKHNVFVSFHGPDVRKSLLSHIRVQFNRKGITMFNDQEIVRSAMIGPSLTEGIRESRIAIVILSKEYASSSWCLDELVEILECKKAMGQIVMTIFYGADPSEVRKQSGDFGKVFKKTCESKTKEEELKWSKALKYVGNIAGEDFLRWDDEATMIEKIAKDVLDKLNATPSRDFDDMVGMETHLRKMMSLLRLDYDGVLMVAITGPAGIGKTTIARALHTLLSDRFQLTFFVDDLRENYYSGFDEYGLKLRLQNYLLTNILDQTGMKIGHLGMIKERLRDLRVLIVLDDVHNITQLEALAGHISWFGPGSRIIVTTENKGLLQQHQHAIDKTYHVKFPSLVEATNILLKYAHKQGHPHRGFIQLANRVTELCGNLPLGLRVVGSSLRGKGVDEWEEEICRLETILDNQDIEKVLRVGFESLSEHEKSLFLHCAVFFNYKDGDLVKILLTEKNNTLIQGGLKILVNRSLIDTSTRGEIVIHKLLQQMCTKIVHEEEPWKHRILIKASDICDVLELEEAKGSREVSGILFDTTGIEKLVINKKAFERMTNLRFLIVYKSKADGNDIMYIPKEMEFPRRLRLLEWAAYSSKYLPSKFCPEYLVEFSMPNSKLEKLWEGRQMLDNLKKMDLFGSWDLKELPDLSNATSLEQLEMSHCHSLVEIPSSFSHLHKLQKLTMKDCRSLRIIPAQMNLASLETVNMEGCLRLRKFPVMSTNIQYMDISETAVEDVPESISRCSCIIHLFIRDNRKLKGITHLPPNVQWVDLSNSHVEKIQDCMKALQQLQELNLSGCRRLTALPELPSSLNNLHANNCKSLDEVTLHLKNTPNAMLSFINNFKLSQQARREIIRGLFFRGSALLPGSKIPAEFNHRATGTSRARGMSLTIPHPAFTKFKVCLVISPNLQIGGGYFVSHLLLCRIYKDGSNPMDKEFHIGDVSKYQKEHLFIFHSQLLNEYIDLSEERREIVLVFSSQSHVFNIVGCGAKVWTQRSLEGSGRLDQEGEEDDEPITAFEDDDDEYDELITENENTGCRSWLFQDFIRPFGFGFGFVVLFVLIFIFYMYVGFSSITLFST